MDGHSPVRPADTRRGADPRLGSGAAGRRWGTKIRRWLARYGLAELGGAGGALLVASWVHAGTHSDIAAAYAATLGETAGFYGVVVAREFVEAAGARRTRDTTYRPVELWGRARRLLLEFGPAELADVVVIRPAAIGVSTSLLGRQIGVPVGKLLADALFYGAVASVYELQRRAAPAEFDLGLAGNSEETGSSTLRA